jgi:hypothetical protein
VGGGGEEGGVRDKIFSTLKLQTNFTSGMMLKERKQEKKRKKKKKKQLARVWIVLNFLQSRKRICYNY